MRTCLIITICLGLFTVGCGKDKKKRRSSEPTAVEVRKSAVGESCSKTADCEGDARCIQNTCQIAEETPTAAPTPAPDTQCSDAKKMAGSWGFTTAVVGAHSQGSIGANGYYQLAIEESNCRLNLSLSKLGYGKVSFKPEKVQRGQATFEPASLSGYDVQASGVIYIANARGIGIDVGLTFIMDGDRMWGHWTYRNTSWTKAGFWGVLQGRRNDSTRMKFKSWHDQPCAVQCRMGCEIPRRQEEGDMYGVPIDACLSSCESKPRTAPTLCRARHTQLAAEDEGFRDRRKGWGWSNRCFAHLKADRLAYAKAACDKGIRVAKRFAKGNTYTDETASKALSALYYNLGLIYDKRSVRSVAIKHYKKAAWWKNGINDAADDKLEALRWKNRGCAHSRRDDIPCDNFPQCCYK